MDETPSITKEEFIRNIKVAFGNVNRPDVDEVFIDSAGHMFDADEASMQLSTVNFHNLDITILNRNRDRISYFTPQGFLAYLPLFLITIISRPHEVDVMVDNLIFYLLPSKKEQSQIRLERRVELLNKEQVEIIIQFFQNYEVFFPRSEWSLTVKFEIEIYQASKYWETILVKKS